jgi:PAS domain S-box-containing protein
MPEIETVLRAILEATGSATVITEADTTIALANDEFAELAGYSKEEIEGKKSWTEFCSRDCLEKMQQYHRLHRIVPGTAPRQHPGSSSGQCTPGASRSFTCATMAPALT